MAQSIKIGILETGESSAEFKRHGSYADCFKRMLSTTSGTFSYNTYQAHNGETPPAPDACNAYLITGSASSVLDPDPWIKSLSKFLIGASLQRPIVGICFGHQLLHQTFGGKVEQSDKGWGIGVHEYDVAQCAKWMKPCIDRVGLMVSHMDQVVQPAKNTSVFASSDFCPYAITTISENILTLQAHPEHTAEYAKDLYGSRRERIGSTHVDAAISSLQKPIHGSTVAEWIAQFITARV